MDSSTPVNTYHCICSTLLLSTTHDIQHLPRRISSNSTGLDAALILPLPSSPPTSELQQESYTILLSHARDPTPVIIRREDGFEKRYLLRCQRCKVIYGYEIARDKSMVAENVGGYTCPILYLLPGALVETQAMARGEKHEDEVFGLPESRGT
jgi:hypothetical protein